MERIIIEAKVENIELNDGFKVVYTGDKPSAKVARLMPVLIEAMAESKVNKMEMKSLFKNITYTLSCGPGTHKEVVIEEHDGSSMNEAVFITADLTPNKVEVEFENYGGIDGEPYDDATLAGYVKDIIKKL